MKGLSRIDSEKKKMHGWYVRVYGGGKTFSKYFSDKKYGGKEKAKKLAIAHLAKMTKEIEKMFPYFKDRDTKTPPFWAKPGKHNKSGVVGVHKTEYWSPTRKHAVKCWVATWNENGKRRDKAFYYSEKGRSEAEAKKMAIEFRARKMKELGKKYDYHTTIGAPPKQRKKPKQAERSWVPGLTIKDFTPIIGKTDPNYSEKPIRRRETFTTKHFEALRAVLGVVADLFEWTNIDFEFGRGLFKGDVRSRCFWNKEGIRTDVIVDEDGSIKVYQGSTPDPFYLEHHSKKNAP